MYACTRVHFSAQIDILVYMHIHGIEFMYIAGLMRS